jgi:hypothetical protein
VTFDFLDRRSAERFAELLDETSGGRRHRGRGPADEELAELIAIGHSLSAARSGVQVDPEFRVGLRAMLVATAERDGIGATATRTETEPGGGHAAAREPQRGLFGRGAGRRIRARGAIVIGVAAGAMAVSGISAASENAAPGDALYGVKRQTERAQLAMAGSDVTRGQLSLDFARTRLTEAAALGDTGDLAGVLDDMDADTRQGVELLTRAAVARRDNSPLATVQSFVAGQQQTLTPMLDRVASAERQRALKSMILLEDVHKRALELRAGLACDPVTPDGSDELGPKLTDCIADKDSSEPAEQNTGQGQKATTKPGTGTGTKGSSSAEPEQTDPTPGPARTGRAGTPAGDPAAPDEEPGTEKPTPAVPIPGEKPADKDKGLLGGILDGIFD